MEGTIKLDGCGYEVTTSSHLCVSVINSYYHQVRVSHHPFLLLFPFLFYHFFFVFFKSVSVFSMKVLSYGRERCVILEAVVHDNYCVLANTLVAHFLYSSDSSKAASYLHTAKSHLVSVTSHLFYSLIVCETITMIIECTKIM